MDDFALWEFSCHYGLPWLRCSATTDFLSPDAQEASRPSTNACTSTWALSQESLTTTIHRSLPRSCDPELYKKLKLAFELLDIFLSLANMLLEFLTIEPDLAFFGTISFRSAGRFQQNANVAKWMLMLEDCAPFPRELAMAVLELKKSST
ncbi:hypothetical protein DOY81_013274, partial [Sarcophaga bullata]